jgi:hypothetical protein
LVLSSSLTKSVQVIGTLMTEMFCAVFWQAQGDGWYIDQPI